MQAAEPCAGCVHDAVGMMLSPILQLPCGLLQRKHAARGTAAAPALRFPLRTFMNAMVTQPVGAARDPSCSTRLERSGAHSARRHSSAVGTAWNSAWGSGGSGARRVLAAEWGWVSDGRRREPRLRWKEGLEARRRLAKDAKVGREGLSARAVVGGEGAARVGRVPGVGRGTRLGRCWWRLGPDGVARFMGRMGVAELPSQTLALLPPLSPLGLPWCCRTECGSTTGATCAPTSCVGLSTAPGEGGSSVTATCSSPIGSGAAAAAGVGTW